jgi:hypothetical protein
MAAALSVVALAPALAQSDRPLDRSVVKDLVLANRILANEGQPGQRPVCGVAPSVRGARNCVRHGAHVEGEESVAPGAAPGLFLPTA